MKINISKVDRKPLHSGKCHLASVCVLFYNPMNEEKVPTLHFYLELTVIPDQIHF